MFEPIVKGLEAYALGSMAKDLGSRWSNPGKVIRGTTNIIQAINEIKAGSTAQDNALDLLKLDNAAQTGQPTTPVVDRTAKDFYNFRKDQYSMNKKIMDKLDALAPKVPATP